MEAPSDTGFSSLPASSFPSGPLPGILVGLRAGGQLVGWGFQFQSPAVVAVTASLFFLIALNLLDIFELRLPIRVSAPTTGGGAGAFLSGLLATVVATPCTAPFMGGALGYALTQPPALGFGVFSALAVGLAAPYVILSAIPGLVKRTPSPAAGWSRCGRFSPFRCWEP